VDTLLQRFGNKVKGHISGFDRLVFKGMLRPIMFAAGAQVFLAKHGVRFLRCFSNTFEEYLVLYLNIPPNGI